MTRAEYAKSPATKSPQKFCDAVGRVSINLLYRMVGTARKVRLCHCAIALSLPPLPRKRRQRAAFAIAGVLVVDPVVRIDPVQRNAVAHPQHLQQDSPRRDLCLGGATGHVGIVA